MALDAGNCVLWDLDPTCFTAPEGASNELIESMQRVASEYLWMMTGRRLGPSCPVTVRPCRKKCADTYGFLWQGQFLGAGYQFTGPFVPYMADGRMYNATFCGCDTDCHCGPELCYVDLPGPVYDIVAVRVDGVVIDPATYEIEGSGRLLRIGRDAAGEPRCWPDCQDMTLSGDQPGTFEVTYRTGLALPAMGSLAVAKLTEHLLKGCSGGGCGCGVGTRQNLQRLSRQGVDLEFADPQELFQDGRTGIEAVDWFIRAVNPYGLASTMRVLSPDAPRNPAIRRSPLGPVI